MATNARDVRAAEKEVTHAQKEITLAVHKEKSAVRGETSAEEKEAEASHQMESLQKTTEKASRKQAKKKLVAVQQAKLAQKRLVAVGNKEIVAARKKQSSAKQAAQVAEKDEIHAQRDADLEQTREKEAEQKTVDAIAAAKEATAERGVAERSEAIAKEKAAGIAVTNSNPPNQKSHDESKDRSNNDSEEGKHVENGLQHHQKGEMHQTEFRSVTREGQVASVKVSHLNPLLGILIGKETTNWITKDGGVTFVVTASGHRFHSTIFHPSRKELILGITKSKLSVCSLLLSEDEGDHWRMISSDVVCSQVAWASGDQSDHMCTVVKHGEKALEKKKGWQPSRDLICFRYQPRQHLVGKPDMLPHGNSFDVVGNYILVATAAQKLGINYIHLYVGNHTQSKMDYTDIQLPPHLLTKGYSILSLAGRQHHALLVVRKSGASGQLYMLDLRRCSFSLLIEDLLSASKLRSSVFAIPGVEGQFLANVYAGDLDKTWVESVVSPDFGRSWVKVQIEGIGGQHIMLSDPGPAASIITPGILVATAVIESGRTLKMVLSRDGGYTWNKLPKSCETCKNSYSFLDSGSLFASINTHGLSPKLLYTADGGTNWEETRLPGRAAHVEYVIAKSQVTTQHLFLGGQHKGSKHGILFVADFSKIQRRRCFGELDPGKEGSDFELWRPEHVPKCFLGHINGYLHRNQHQNCRIIARPGNIREHCACRNQDYECIPSSEEHTVTCVPPTKLPIGSVSRKQLCALGSHAELVAGYRLLDGNTCVGGTRLPTTVTDCVDRSAKPSKRKKHHHAAHSVEDSEDSAEDSVEDGLEKHTTTPKKHHSASSLRQEMSGKPKETSLWWKITLGVGLAFSGIGIIVLVICFCQSSSHKYQKVQIEDPNLDSLDGGWTNSPETLFDDEPESLPGPGHTVDHEMVEEEEKSGDSASRQLAPMQEQV